LKQACSFSGDEISYFMVDEMTLMVVSQPQRTFAA